MLSGGSAGFPAGLPDLIINCMNKKLFVICLGAIAFSMVACSRQEQDTISTSAPQREEVYEQAKIINTVRNSEPGSILVKTRSVLSEKDIDRMIEGGVVSVKPLFTSTPGREELEKRFGLDRWYEVEVEEDKDIEDVAMTLTCFDNVSKIQYNSIFSKASDCKTYPYEGGIVTKSVENATFNDPSLQAQWHYINTGDVAVSAKAYAGGDINVKDVWTKLTTGDRRIIVAVVDEGVKYTHPDLADNMWTGPNGEHGKNFVTGGDITWDKTFINDEGQRVGDSGHGTHCAGTIAAVNNNNIGVSGVAGGSGKKDGVQIMSCQIFDGGKGGTTAVSVKAIKYAADNGASIISCSFGYDGGTFKSDGEYEKYAGAEADAIRYFENADNNDVLDGNIAIFASGNDGLNYAEYPGALYDIISVSAFGPDYLPTYYTNYGPGCNIVAPGGEFYHYNSASKISSLSMVLSTLPSELNDGKDYGYMQGTSMACPHVSGVVALAMSYALKLGKHFTRKEFKDMIVTSANDFDTRLNGLKTLYGGKNLDLSKFRKLMGTGSIDAWKLMMKIEGIPSIVVETGKNQWVDLSSYFGTSSVNLKYLSVSIDEEGKKSLGIAQEPYIKYGKLYIHPTTPGSCKVKITAVGGGTSIGGNDSIGGMEVSQEVSIIARGFKSSTGGWL